MLLNVPLMGWLMFFIVGNCFSLVRSCEIGNLYPESEALHPLSPPLHPHPCRVCSSCLPTLDWWRFRWPTVPTTWAVESACCPGTPTVLGPGGCVRTWGWRRLTGERSDAQLWFERRSSFSLSFRPAYVKRGLLGMLQPKVTLFFLRSVTGSRTWRRRTRQPFVTGRLWVPDQPVLQLHVSVAPGSLFTYSINF